MTYLNEDTLVQQTTADYLRDQLGWESVYAHNQETFGPEGLLGRNSDREVVLTRYLKQALKEFNKGLPKTAYDEAVRQVVDYSQSQSMLSSNFDKYKLFKNGVLVSFQGEHGKIKKERLKIFDFNEATHNHFLAVRELWVQGGLYRRRIDIAGFINGIPLLFIECKNIHKDIRNAYEKNLADYKDTIQHFFHHNAIVMFANGAKAKIGTITAGYEHFHEWKRLSESEYVSSSRLLSIRPLSTISKARSTSLSSSSLISMINLFLAFFFLIFFMIVFLLVLYFHWGDSGQGIFYSIKLKAGKSPKFKAGKVFKDAVK
jgi:type I restriction enzyme R subunit